MERYTLRLFDNMSHLVLQQEQGVAAGEQYLELNGLGKFPNGFYSLQIISGSSVEVHKLIKK